MHHDRDIAESLDSASDGKLDGLEHGLVLASFGHALDSLGRLLIFDVLVEEVLLDEELLLFLLGHFAVFAIKAGPDGSVVLALHS